MTTGKDKSGFYFGVTCPACGGELELEKNFFTLTCVHCGSVLRIRMPDMPPAYLVKSKLTTREVRFGIDRYLKKNSLPLTGPDLAIKNLYYPYWKIEALMLRVRNKVYERVLQEETEYQDWAAVQTAKTEIGITPYLMTVAAGSFFDGIPDSIGLRSEYVRMIPFAKENIQDGFDSLPITRPYDEVWATVVSSVMTVGDIDQADFGSNLTELFHPEYELIYFPYALVESYSDRGFNRFIVDGISGRVVEYLTQLTLDEDAEYAEIPPLEFGRLEVEYHRCYNCGMDLPDRRSIVYICENCQVLNIIDKTGVDIGELALVDCESGPADVLLPFWSFKIPDNLLPKLGQLFGGIRRSDRLVVPAFSVVNYEAAYRLSKRMSAAAPQLNLVPTETYDRRFRPVNRCLEDALALADIIIYRAQLERLSTFHCNIEKFEFHPSEVSLFYTPFHPENYFYVDSALNAITFEKNLVEQKV
ncbi:MAG: hypothetical protein JXA92_03595 [candidate division Zixibacteria bacterium]|nr:hypothetical protein [candidate division Zixibacteria bacterium]